MGQLLEIRGLTVEYRRGRRRRAVRAVDDVSFDVGARETVAVVGESGSGKTSIARAALGLVPVHAGQIVFDGRDVTHETAAGRARLSRHLQAVFQDPVSSLNPTKSVLQTVAEPLLVHEKPSRAQRRARVEAQLRRVGLPADAADRYPMQFSGGERQRIAIARALICSPRLVVCDEALSGLDLSIQAQIINLLRSLRAELGLSYLLIGHDLAVVPHLSDRVVVLYRGHLVESGPATAVCDAPSHPYTQALFAAAPVPDPASQALRRGERRRVRRTEPAPAGRDGCPWVSRCPLAIDRCGVERPRLMELGGGRRVACHRAGEAAGARPR